MIIENGIIKISEEERDKLLNALRPKGEWIETIVRGSKSLVCSKCGSDLGSICETKYCPNCGAKMESEE